VTHGFALAGIEWLLAAVVMALLWAGHLRLKNAGLVDPGWTGLVAALAIIDACYGGGTPARRSAIGFMMGSWGARLTIYLLYDRVLGRPEDGRFAELRRKFGARATPRFFWFFQSQAFAAVLFSLPALFAASNDAPEFSPIEYVAAALWIVAFSGETTADRQLLHFKMDPDNRGRVCQAGLWRFSRHPNYFFEWIMWVAYALFASAAPWGWLTFVCPAILLFLLLKVTGIPATEAQAIRSRGDAYKRYQETTSAFVPWRPGGREADA
jgi:steroid 5-alpha reductase family enzyme